jgi:nitrogen fixation protein FixH
MKWIVGVVGLLAANVIAMAILAVTANAGKAQVIPAYYDQALRYDDVLDDAAKSRALGWKVDASIVGGSLEVVVRDATGAVITGATAKAKGYQRTRADAPFEVALPGNGLYRAALPTVSTGWYDVVIVVERGRERFTHKLSIEAR